MLAVAALLLASAVPASLVTFAGPPAPEGAITFAANGALSGTVPIATATGHAITGGVLSFAMARPLFIEPDRAGYAFGGSFTLTGSFDGGPTETILASARDISGGTINNLGNNRWFLSVAFGPDAIAHDVLDAYGIPGIVGFLAVDFVGAPGSTIAAGASVVVTLDFGPAHPAPEPGSLSLLGVGIIMSAIYLSRR